MKKSQLFKLANFFGVATYEERNIVLQRWCSGDFIYEAAFKDLIESGKHVYVYIKDDEVQFQTIERRERSLIQIAYDIEIASRNLSKELHKYDPMKDDNLDFEIDC